MRSSSRYHNPLTSLVIVQRVVHQLNPAVKICGQSKSIVFQPFHNCQRFCLSWWVVILFKMVWEISIQIHTVCISAVQENKKKSLKKKWLYRGTPHYGLLKIFLQEIYLRSLFTSTFKIRQKTAFFKANIKGSYKRHSDFICTKNVQEQHVILS